MRHALRLIVASLAVLSSARSAHADTATCVTAAEDAQRAQKAGHLLVAAESFAECSASTCPASVRDDCSKWRADVEAQTPTIVVDAKGPDGRDVSDVTVSIDGVVATRKLDGRGLAVDPGSHRFSFSRAGSTTVLETAIVKEGVKDRVFAMRFKPDSNAESPASVPAAPRGHTVFPFLLGGIGVVAIVAGVVVILITPGLPANCNGDTQLCEVPLVPGIDQDKYRAEQLPDDTRKAGKHHGYPIAGGATIAGGALALAGGIIWFLLEPTSAPKKVGAGVEPWLDRNSAGLGLGGTF